MAIYKARFPDGTNAYSVWMPDNALGYMVWLPDAAAPTESIEVDMVLGPPGASWTLTNSISEIVATGSVSMPPTQFAYETYTLTWQDTAFTHEPPAAFGPTVLSSGNPITFELTEEPPASGLNPGEIQITLTASDAADIQHVSWSLHGPDTSAIVASGTGDQLLTANPDGAYYVTWGWTQYHWTPTGHDSNTHPSGVGPNGPWTSATQTLSANGKEFDGDYQARAMPTRAQSAFCMDVPPGGYWRGDFNLANPMLAYSGWQNNSGGRPPLDADFWPTSLPNGTVNALCQMPPSGTDTVQTYWVFWNGTGTLSINGGNGGTGLTNFNCALGSGQTGTSFTFGPSFGLTQNSNGSSWCTLNITSTGSGGNYLRDIEIVHEDYCGNGTDKSYRDVTVGSNFNTDLFYHHYDHCGAIRMLEQIDQVYTPQPSGEEGLPWTSNAFGTGISGFELEFLVQGRQLGSEAHIDGSTVGAAWQVYVDQANAADKDLWINMPTFSNDTLCDQIISIIEAPYVVGGGGGLRDGLKVHLEYSNETWGGHFMGLDYCQFWGQWHSGETTDQFNRTYSSLGLTPKGTPTQGFADSSRGYGASARYTSYRTWQLVNLWKANSNYIARGHSSFGARVTVIAASFVIIPGTNYWHFRENGNSGGTLVTFDGVNPYTDVVDVYSVTNYTTVAGNGTWGDWPPADFESYADVYFDEWLNTINTTKVSHVTSNAAVATNIGVELWGYETGQGIDPSTQAPAWTDYIENHPRMYEVYSALNAVWKDNGGKFSSHYKGPQYWQNDGGVHYWGIKSGSLQPDDKAYRYMAQVDFACNNHKWW